MRTALIAVLLAATLAPAPARAQGFELPPEAPVPSGRFRALVQTVFTQDNLLNPGDPGYENGYGFEAFDERNGYARVKGPFEGHDDFFLLKGKTKDFVAFVEYACDPSCAEKVSLFRMDSDTAPVAVPLMSVLDLRRFDRIERNLRAMCLSESGAFDQRQAARPKSLQGLPPCPFALSFSKDGGPAQLFKIANEDGSSALLSMGRTVISSAVVFTWTGNRLAGNAAGDGARMVLSVARMKALF